MALYYYLKSEIKNETLSHNLIFGFLQSQVFSRTRLRFISLFFFSFGLGLLSWLIWPFLEWRVIYVPQLNDTEIKRPLPALKGVVKANEGTRGEAENLVYVRNWFPQAPPQASTSSDPVNRYTLSIPKLKISEAEVLIGGEDLSKGLIHYGGTALPGKNGTSVVFGHSVLPQFFNPKKYMTIFSTLHTLKEGDKILVKFDGIEYIYQIFGFEIVDPSNTSFLDQKNDDSYIYLITCTPPGTYWKRLVVKAKLKGL